MQVQVVQGAYNLFIPEFVDRQARPLMKEFSAYIGSFYRGPDAYRYSGTTGNEFLKSKWIFVPNNPIELARSLLFITVIGTVGYLISSFLFSYMAIGVAGASAFCLLSVTKEYFKGNQMEQALKYVVDELNELRSDNPFDELEAATWDEKNPASIDLSLNEKWTCKKLLDSKGAVVAILFNITEDKKDSVPSIQGFYFGYNYATRRSKNTDTYKFSWRPSLTGGDISKILNQLKP